MDFRRGQILIGCLVFNRVNLRAGCWAVVVLAACLATAQPVRAWTVDDPELYDAVLAEQNLDAIVHDVCVVSLDRAWAVGDRGLILVTSDGGKNWYKQNSPVTCPLHCVKFLDDKVGIAVGGWVQPNSYRSLGVVLTTQDGGKNWRHVTGVDVPRLFGVQHVGGTNWMAWGDFSPSQQSSIFASADHGKTWGTSKIQLGHVHRAVWTSWGQGILIDRLNRVIQVEAGIDLSELYIPVKTPTRWKAIHYSKSGFWLAGDGGQLAHSLDGKRWDVHQLPGTVRDRQLYRASDIHAVGQDVWVVGQPGSVVWHSADSGITWEMNATNNELPLNAIDAVQADRLLAVGASGLILGTRNGGKGWWTERSVARRASLLNVALNRSSATWNAVALASNDDRRTSAVMLVKPESIESRADALPDLESRSESLSSRLGLAWVGVLRQPNDGDSAPSRTTLIDVDYQSSVAESYIRQIANAIRTLRPEVLIIDNLSQRNPEAAAAAKMVLYAEKLAANPEFRIFSNESKISDKPWKVSKIYTATNSSNGKLGFDDAQLVKPIGKLLGQITSPSTTIFPRQRDSTAATSGLTLLESSVQTALAETKLFGGLLVAEDGARPVPEIRSSNYQILMGNLQRQTAVEKFMGMPGPKLRDDPRWNATLEMFVQASGSAPVGAILFETARQSRQQGYWNRWRACLDKIIQREPNSGAAEMAWHEMIVLSGSSEMNNWMTLSQAMQPSSNIASGAVAVSSKTPVSPFQEKGVESEASMVKQASFDQMLAKPGINETETSPGQGDGLEASVSLAASASVEPIVHTKMIDACYQSMFAGNSPYLFDHRLQLIQASRLLSSGNVEKKPEAVTIFDQLAANKSIAGWCQVGLQESQWVAKASADDSANRVRFVDTPPWLDGEANESTWLTATSRELTDPLNAKRLMPVTIRSTYDSKHLYFAIQCPIIPGQELPIENSKQRTRDGADRRRDHVVIRLDTDRDYASWYELVVDEDGQVAESCCGMEAWNPQWFVARHVTTTSWSVEIAVPLRELGARSPEPGTAWAASFYRSIPQVGVQHDGRVVSEENLPQGMRLLIFE